MRILVLDSESDGLAYDCTKLHVLSYTTDGETYHSTGDYDDMRAVLDSADLIVAHNSIRHDQVVFNRILGIPMDFTKWADTLALSWYLYPDRQKHGLAEWGLDLGVAKPKVDDWQNLSYEEYAHRCEADCAINWRLWVKMKKRLEEIYN
jgi:DNA polymerase III alpha subunit (gram-positive type)